MTVCYHHITYAFQSESTLCSCLNVKERLAPNRHNIQSLGDSNRIRTHNHLVHKQTLNHFPKLVYHLQTKWLWVLTESHCCHLRKFFDHTIYLNLFRSRTHFHYKPLKTQQQNSYPVNHPTKNRKKIHWMDKAKTVALVHQIWMVRCTPRILKSNQSH